MKVIKPVKAKVDFGFPCEKCGTLYWFGDNEVKVPGFKFVCCDTVYQLLQIDNINVSYNTQAKVTDTALVKKALEAMVDFGYSKKEASKLIVKAIENDKTITDPTDLVRKAISYETTKS